MDELKGSVIVYSKIGCSDSLRAKNLLASLAMPYLDICLDAFPKVEEQLFELIGKTVETPQIFFNHVRVSGYKELRRLAASSDAWEEILKMLENGDEQESLKSESSHSETDSVSSSNIKCMELETSKSDLIPDDYDKLVKIFRRANLIRNSGHNQAHRNSFKGEDFINFVMREQNVNRNKALELGQLLIDKHFGPRLTKDQPMGGLLFCSDHYYLIHDEDPTAPLNVVSMMALNECDLTIPVDEMNSRLCTVLQRLYDQILSEDRRLVYYERLENNESFRSYLALASDFSRLDLKSASKDGISALFINIYNMMLIHIVYKYGVHSNIWQKRRFYNTTYYLISKHRYSLQSIYNGILRGNRIGLNMLWEPFGPDDLRKEHALKDPSPLVHFALNAYCFSTPPIRVFSVENLTSELRDNARQYLEKPENLWCDIKKQTISLSKYFKWYASDFGDVNDQAIEWISDLLDNGQTKENLARIYLSGQFTINYLPFNFDPNMIKENCFNLQ